MILPIVGGYRCRLSERLRKLPSEVWEYSQTFYIRRKSFKTPWYKFQNSKIIHSQSYWYVFLQHIFVKSPKQKYVNYCELSSLKSNKVLDNIFYLSETGLRSKFPVLTWEVKLLRVGSNGSPNGTAMYICTLITQ